MGEGVFAFKGGADYYFYNIVKNSAVKVQSTLSESNIHSVLRCAELFHDGVSITVHGFVGICKITSDGKIEVMPKGFHSDLNQAIGNPYYDRENERLIRMGYTYHQDGFSVFDSKGNIVKKQTAAELADESGFNEEGLAFLLLQNKEGTCYYTVMDTTGTFLFEPLKVDSAIVVDAVSGAKVKKPDSNAETHVLVDRDGTVLYQQTASGNFDYNNGVVCDGSKYVVIEK